MFKYKRTTRIIASVVMASTFLTAQIAFAAQEEPSGGYVVADWAGAPVAIDDDATISDIERMTDGVAVPVDEDEAVIKGEKSYRSTIDEISGSSEALETCFPAAYTATKEIDSALSGRLPSARNQGSYGTCWAHESIALAEGFMINQKRKSTSLDYSERHLAYYTYMGDSNSMGLSAGDSRSSSPSEKTIMGKGGNLINVAQSLMKWRGVADESVAKYSDIGTSTPKWSQSLEFTSSARLKNYYILDGGSNRQVVKRFVKAYGGVGVSLVMAGQTSSYYNAANNAYYCPSNVTPDHGVVIVGWDDSFPKSNFNTAPEGNGAWLVRNSYQENGTLTSNPYKSYFWLSYYDKTLTDYGVFKLQDSDEFSKYNYYYDNTIHNSGWLNSSGHSIKAANIYLAKGPISSEVIDSVSLQTVTNSSGKALDYKIQIYTDLKDYKKPDSGTLAAEQTGTLPFLGCYTIDLDTPVYVQHGARFAVVVTLQDGAKTVDVETVRSDSKAGSGAINGISYKVNAFSGQSFYKIDDQSWIDTTSKSYGNFCIGVQTSDAPGATPVAIPDTDSSDGRSTMAVIFMLAALGAGLSLFASRRSLF